MGRAIAAAAQDDDPLQVVAQFAHAVGGVADDVRQGWPPKVNRSPPSESPSVASSTRSLTDQPHLILYTP